MGTQPYQPRMLRFLALLCFALLALLGAEWTWQPASLPVADAARPVPVMPPPPHPAASPSHGQFFSEILARPLFAPDRRPVAGVAAADPTLPRLAGVISTPEGIIAIFQPENGGKPVLVHSGEQVAGWDVEGIAGQQVTLRKGGQSMVLHPRFASVEAAPSLVLPLRR